SPCVLQLLRPITKTTKEQALGGSNLEVYQTPNSRRARYFTCGARTDFYNKMDAATKCRWPVFLTVVMALTLGAFATSPALADVNGCPTGNFANRQTSNRVGATATVTCNMVSYTFEWFVNEGSGGVTALIEYCVYSGTKPDSVTTVATGANGSAWEDPQQFDNSCFQRRNGNPSNIPYDGASHAMGSATWMSGVPGNFDRILLHINDAVECNNLYGGNPGTCF